jgi:hypothetical protein
VELGEGLQILLSLSALVVAVYRLQVRDQLVAVEALQASLPEGQHPVALSVL